MRRLVLIARSSAFALSPVSSILNKGSRGCMDSRNIRSLPILATFHDPSAIRAASS